MMIKIPNSNYNAVRFVSDRIFNAFKTWVGGLLGFGVKRAINANLSDLEKQLFSGCFF
ncbi:hypothetical protein HMPREF0476_0055 [Kingella kingae ATCC 23330]|uniref:Uncharacterized protein n=1 Tax=Kingella kingae ATCC 23330 TaxID=887327 RepID=F5S4C2_KINKI|nr:hypothetical protein HMPREF0476_0055 [Kingella kingae ATCC 23330]